MTFEQLKQYFLAKPQVTLEFPFGNDVYVFKVKNKMFGLIGWKDEAMNVNLKCDPDESVALRDIFSNITPGYHMNKKHWITIVIEADSSEQSVPQGEIERLIDNSFTLVVSKMTKKDRQSILVHC